MSMRLAFCAVPLLLLSACYSPSTQRPGYSDAELYEEERIQQQMIDEAAKMGGRPRPWRKAEKINKRFTAVAERMEPAAAQVCQELGLPKLKRRCYYYFRLSRSADINAHASGDEIVVNYGMMSFVENEDELAVVVGHEIAHNMMGHIDASNENAIWGRAIGGLLGTAAGMTPSESLDTGELAGALSYSQSFEAEADYVGLYIAARAGYNIKRAPEYWRRLAVEHPQGQYISTSHPTHPERFVLMKKTIAEIEYKRKHRMVLLPNMIKNPIEGDYDTAPDIF